MGMPLARLCASWGDAARRGEEGTKCPTAALGFCHQNSPEKQMQQLEQEEREDTASSQQSVYVQC